MVFEKILNKYDKNSKFFQNSNPTQGSIRKVLNCHAWPKKPAKLCYKNKPGKSKTDQLVYPKKGGKFKPKNYKHVSYRSCLRMLGLAQ